MSGTQPHPNVLRVSAAATTLGLSVDMRRFPEGTKTAADAAAAIGVEVGQIVKSLVFAVDGEVVSRSRRRGSHACMPATMQAWDS